MCKYIRDIFTQSSPGESNARPRNMTSAPQSAKKGAQDDNSASNEPDKKRRLGFSTQYGQSSLHHSPGDHHAYDAVKPGNTGHALRCDSYSKQRPASSLTMTRRQYAATVEKLRHENKKLVNNSEMFGRQQNSLLDRCQVLENNGQELRDWNLTLHTNNQKLKIDNEQLYDECKRLQCRFHDLGTGNGMLHDTNKHLQAAVHKLEIENQALRSSEDNANGNIQRLGIEIGELQSNLKILRLNFQTQDAENKKLLAKISELRGTNNKLKSDIDYANSRCRYFFDNCIQPYLANKGHLRYDETDTKTIDRVFKSLLGDALGPATCRSQVHHLEQQVQSLQQQLLSNVEKIQVVTDAQFTQVFRDLASTIKTFSRSIELSDAIDVLDIKSIRACLLACGVKEEYWTTITRKNFLIEAFIWSTLCDFLFDGPFSYYGMISESFTENYFEMFGKNHQHRWPVPSELAERWRLTTVEQLVNIAGSKAIKQSRMINVQAQVENSTQRHRELVANSIAEPLTQLSTNTDFATVPAIIDKAFALSLKMSLQRCRLQVVFPAIGERYIEGATPSLTSVPESEEVERGYVGFIVKPGLAKWGDAHGQKLDQRLDLVPSVVFVDPNYKATGMPTVGCYVRINHESI